MYLNKAILIGNLTRDPELKALPGGSKVASFGLATNRVYKDKEGKKQESVEFHNIVVFGRMAETVSQYMKKGSQILIEGRIQTRQWEDKNGGGKKSRTEIVAETFQFGRSGGAGGASGAGAGQGTGKGSDKGDKAAAAPAEAIEYPTEEINPDDIPF